MIKVKDEKGLVRDPSSKAILSVDTDALKDHRRKKAMMLKIHEESSKVSQLEEIMEQQSAELAELKRIVQLLLDK